MIQMSIFSGDNAKQDLLKLIDKEKRLQERKLRRNLAFGISDDYPRGYLDCLDLMGRKIKKALEGEE